MVQLAPASGFLPLDADVFHQFAEALVEVCELFQIESHSLTAVLVAKEPLEEYPLSFKTLGPGLQNGQHELVAGALDEVDDVA
jgi:hypothetical protein